MKCGLICQEHFIVEKKYCNYSVKDFTQDLTFIDWVKKGVNQKDWETFILENPQLSKNIETAKEIVNVFRYSGVNVSEIEKYNVWKNIELFYTHHHKKGRKLQFRKILRYAAMIAFLLAIGSISSYLYLKQNNTQFTEIKLPASNSNEAKLILSGGEEFLLKEKQSELQFDSTGKKIKIDRDSLINYQSEGANNELAQVIIPYGMRSEIKLSDGTIVWLNAGSRLIFPHKFTGKDRHVFLKGEAFFDVVENRNIPFIVTTDNINITVLGTEFNIKDNNSDSELEVVLVEGEIRLKENSVFNFLDKEIKLVPNQKAVYNKIENKMLVESGVDVTYYTSWKEGLFKFRRESILNVFKQLSRYYDVRFVTESSVELNQKFSGKLDLKESLEDVLKVISEAAPISYRFEEGKVYVNSNISYMRMR